VSGPLILALDVATTTGFAHGPAGGHIISGSFRAGAPGASNAEVGRAYGAWLKDIRRGAELSIYGRSDKRDDD
jgi:hypothetical protein